mgnify:CR=1 FL=1
MIGSWVPSISVDKLEQLVIDELNHLAAEYLDKDELEQNIEFSDNLQEQKKRLLSDIAVYEKKIAEYSKGCSALSCTIRCRICLVPYSRYRFRLSAYRR